MNRIVLIIPDAGPLISLARADALGLLLLVGVPVYIVDEVFHETIRNRSFPDARTIEAFVAANPSMVHVHETDVGKLSARMREIDPAYAPPGQGEAAFAQFLARLHEITEPDAPVLILFEDSDVKRIQIVADGNARIISTKAFLRGLEQRGLIRSAEEVWKGILATGRRPSEREIDREPRGFPPSTW